MYLTESSLIKLFKNIFIKMPWYAVARGTKPGVYKTWDECAAHVKNFSGAKFRKFTTQEEALAFVKEFGFTKNAIKTENTEMYEINANRLESSPTKTQTIIPHVSSPKLKANALKQRLSIIEKLYEQSMLEIRIEIDSVKERIESFDAHTNVTCEMNEGTENFKSLQESLSKLANSYRNSVEELKKEIGDLRTSIESLESELSQQATSDGSSYSHMSSFKRNLFNNAVVPVATKRLYSTNADEPSKRKRRKHSTDNENSHEVATVQSSSSSLSGFELDENGYVKVYTDGACTKNGRVGARAGVGVFFGDGHPLNYSEPVQGRQTNNTAEIQAATCALDLARKAEPYPSPQGSSW
ncbi:hypothetical protein C0J52_02707 [Blattella germanica]|nr:hypothetical protein C0J52_02707 [Blattella germanica]